MTGLVHSIETFSTSDGPGIRTVVFLQGCMLRCIYCQNPDTWSMRSEAAREYSPQALMDVVSRNQPYFQASGGGITFSGGEPMLQHGFVSSVFQLCRKKQIHTAFESSLFCRTQHIKEVLPNTDLVLADIKTPGHRQSRSLTTANPDSHIHLDNLKIIDDRGIPICLRYVVLPGWTDQQSSFDHLSSLARELEMVNKVELLPYHALGRHKWAFLGLDYHLDTVPAPDRSRLEKIALEMQRSSGKPVHVR